MKNLIATLAIAAAFVGVATTASAQAAGPKTQGGQSNAQQEEKNIGDIRKDALAQLSLTEEQKKKIKQLHKSNKEKNAALKAELEKSTLSSDAKKEKQHALRKEQMKALRDLLTPDQQKKFDAYLEEETKKLRKEKKKGGDD